MPGGWVAILHFSAFESKFALFQMLCMLFLRLLLKEILREEKEKGTVQLKRKKKASLAYLTHTIHWRFSPCLMETSTFPPSSVDCWSSSFRNLFPKPWILTYSHLTLSWASLIAQLVKKKICLQCKRPSFNSWVERFPGEGIGYLLGEVHWLKPPTLARHHSNHLHELF